MAVLVCPRCRRSNPAPAVFCYFDGEALRAGQDGTPHRLPIEFAFPSGRRCHSYADLAQACQEEWADARDLLQRGTFAHFFASCGRADLARAAEEARTQPNHDIGLSRFVSALPGARQQVPRLDLQPRRVLVGKLMVGETKQVQLTITNQGQGILQGTVTVAEGQDWLSLAGGKPVHESPVTTPKQQVLTLHVQTRGLASGQNYKAKLTVVTNGGVVEVPLSLDVVAQPFSKPPFQGVRTQRELAERMRTQPKAGVPLLESGDVQRWFTVNGWTYPVSGPEMKGVAAVQQFFEALGLSKPPPLQLSQSEIHLRCRYPSGVSHQLTLQTGAKKWVYGQVTSDRPWLRLPSSQVSGPQHATIALEVDLQHWEGGPRDEAVLQVLANGGQKLSARVTVEVMDLPAAKRPRAPATPGGLRSAVLTGVLLLLLLRLLLAPLVDLSGRGGAARAAAERLGYKTERGAPMDYAGAWLALPWPGILAGDTPVPAAEFQPNSETALPAAEFRREFAAAFIRHLVALTWWLGIPLGAWLVRRAGGTGLDLFWGLVAGAVAGVVGSATVACVFLALDLVPHVLWYPLLGSRSGVILVVFWSLFAALCWAGIGAAVFLGCWLLPPLRRAVVVPAQRGLAQLFRWCGLRQLADRWAPAAAGKVLAF